MIVQDLAFLPVLAAAVYLLLFGVYVFIQPARARSFLTGFAQTFGAHVFELVIRIVIGAALVARAPSMHLTSAFAVMGWILIVSSAVLAVLPWRLHQRFARWSVPLATQRMPLVGVGAIVGGLAVLAALMLPRGAA